MLAGFATATATAWPLGPADAQPAQTVPQVAADPTASAPAVRLPELRVEGARETATGPVAGYVAERSATGTKTDTPLIETPQSASVITSDRIQAQNIDTLNQAMLYTPGAFATSVDFRGEYFNLRGFAADIYLDGLRVPVPVPAQSFRIEPWGMERIEVLRGASSVLYGQANLGGIVNAVSKRPRPDMVSQVAIQGGSFGRIQGMFDVGGAAGRDGSLLWRFNGLVRDSDTYVDFGRDNRIYLAPSLAWRPTADTSLTVLASYLRDDLGVTGQWLLPQGTVLPNPNGTIPRGRSTGEPGFDRYRKSQYAIGTILEHRLNADWAVRQNPRYTYQELDYATIFTDLTFVPPNQQRVAGRSASYQAPLHWSVAVDNQAEGRFRTGPLDHRVLFGLDYRVQRSHNRTWTARA